MRDVTGDKDYAAAARAAQEAGSEARRWLGSMKTPYGQKVEEGKAPDPGMVQNVGETLLSAAPATAAAIATGPFAPLTFGSIAHASARAEMWDKIRYMSEAQLYQTPNYAKYREQGMDDDEAREQIFRDGLTPGSVAMNVGGNIIFGGVAQRALAPVVKGLAGEAQLMTGRVLRNAGVGGLEAAGAGAALGAGSEGGRQAGEIGAGLREDYDTGRITDATAAGALNLGILGTALGAAKGFRAPRTRVGEKAADLVDKTGYTN